MAQSRRHLLLLLLSLLSLALCPAGQAALRSGTTGTGGDRVKQEAGPTQLNEALQAVEDDQEQPEGEATGFFSANLAANRYLNYAHASSYRGGQTKNAFDGKPESAWTLDDKIKQGWIEGSIGLLATIDKIIVREHKDRVRSFHLQVYDGTQWQSVARGEKLGTKTVALKPMQVSGVRLDITTRGGGGIAEIELYNTADPEGLLTSGYPPSLRKAFAQGRVALLLGSPLALTRKGRQFINPREHEVRPLPDSRTYLADVLLFLLKQFDGKGEWDKAGCLLTGEIKGKPFSFTLPEAALLETREPLLKVYQHFASQATIPCVADPAQPDLLLFGPPLPAAAQMDVFKTARDLLLRGEGSLQHERSPGGTPQKAIAVVTPSPRKIGTTMKWVGARNGGLEKGMNQEAWLGYIHPNAIRTWYGNSVFRQYVKLSKKQVTSWDDFEKEKADVRENPEESSLIDWKRLLTSELHAGMAYEYGVYRTLGLEIVNETGAKEWNNNAQENLYAWLVTYAATYHLAKHFDVAVHQYGNEPDSDLLKHDDAEIVLKLQLVGDAIHCAIADVNKRYGKNLKACYAAPVLASSDSTRITALMMRNLRTDYRGKPLKQDLVQYYNRHRYSSRPRQTVQEALQQEAHMRENAATGKTLPQLYTEINYSTGRNWARAGTSYTSDSPEVFASMGSHWGQMMACQQVAGAFLFKLNSESLRWSNTVCYEFVRERDPEPSVQAAQTHHQPKADIGYSTKNAEVLRLFAEGFSGQQELLDTKIQCEDLHYQAYTAYNPKTATYYLWTVQVNERADYPVELDLSRLDVAAGAPLLIKEVGPASFGGVVFNGTLPASRKITLVQPRHSVWLITIPKGKRTAVRDFPVIADASIRQGKCLNQNFGQQSTLSVQRHSLSDNNQMTFLKFSVGAADKKNCHKALLRVYGRRVSDYAFDDSYTFRVYGLLEDHWQELELTAMQAPAVCQHVSAVRQGVLSLKSPPVGHLSFVNTPGFSEIDVTRFVKEHPDQELTFLLIREMKWPGENSDFAGAELVSREGDPSQAPRLQIHYGTP